VRIKNQRGPARAQGKRRAGPGASGNPGDLTDAPWQAIAPHLPAEMPGRRGRPRIWPARRIVAAILYLDWTGCVWRYLPSDGSPDPPMLLSIYACSAGANSRINIGSL